MKVASLALVLIATANASLFEDDEDFGLQEQWEDFEDDRFLQVLDENEGESDPDFMNKQENLYDEKNQRRRGEGRRSGRGRGRGKGRRSKKNRKQKKETFDYQTFLQKIDDKEEKMEIKLDDKCDRQIEWSEKICAQLTDKTDCKKWTLAQDVKCQEYGSCRIQNFQDKGKCMAAYKHMMWSVMSEKVDPRPNVTNEDIGQCFTDVLIEAKECSDKAASEYSKAMQGVVELTEQEMETAKAALKDQRKLKMKQRKEQKMSRKGRNNRRGNNRRGQQSRRVRRGRHGGMNNNQQDEEEFQPRSRRGGRGKRGQNYNQEEEDYEPRSRRNNRRSNNNQYEEDYESQTRDETDFVPHRFT